MNLAIDPASIKGFMPYDEGRALFEIALTLPEAGFPVIEIGTYCGKSALYIGSACKLRRNTLFAIDHHRGSEENQPGWEHHDPETWDDEAEAMDTLPFLRRTLRKADLEHTVIPVVGDSNTVAKHWFSPISMLFIDGGHGEEPAHLDYRAWTGKIEQGGILAIHDVFPDPNDGGRPPFEIYQKAMASGLFEEINCVGSLRILQKL